MPNNSETGDRQSNLASGWTVSDGASGAGASGAGAADKVADAEPEAQALQPLQSATAVQSDSADSDDAPAASSQVSNLTLVILGVIGGIYLLYSVGWFLIAQYFSAVNNITASNSGLIGGVLQQMVFWSAALAAPLWFLSSLLLARGKKPLFMSAYLLLGLIILMPWPLFIAGGGE